MKEEKDWQSEVDCMEILLRMLIKKWCDQERELRKEQHINARADAIRQCRVELQGIVRPAILSALNEATAERDKRIAELETKTCGTLAKHRLDCVTALAEAALKGEN